MTQRYDVIVVGARCAGASSAMLLARAGYRVLLTDKASFPSDTISTHVIHPPGVAALARWGLLDALAASGCPAIETYSFDFGALAIAGTPRASDGVASAYCPRRTVLDKLLVDAAVAAGAELREGFAVDELLSADGVVGGIRGRTQTGKMTTERAAVVVGADGRHSRVAKLVQASDYNRRPSRMAMYYAYWSGLHVEGFQTTIRAERKRGWAAAPTNDALTMLGFGWPIEEFHQNRGDIEGNFWAAVELDPEFAEQLRGARRESRFAGTAELGGYFREPYGPGWALVGDAGYHKNPITAMGINDAFRDAALLARALDESLSGGRAYEEAMRDYQRARDRDAAPVYEFTDEFARLEPPPPQMQQLLAAIRDNQDAIDAFIGVQAATVPAPEFFAPQNIDSLMAQAATA